MIIEVVCKVQFGRKRFFANNDAATIILKLMRAKCFTLQQVKFMQEQEWIVNITIVPIEI